MWRRVRDWLQTYRPIIIVVTGGAGRSSAARALELVMATTYNVRLVSPKNSDPVAVALAMLGREEDPATISWYTAVTKSLAREIVEEEPAVLIIDIGADRPGDLDWVGQRLTPDVTVVTDVGSANLELFVNKENRAHEMASLVVSTKASGAVVVNQDDELTAPLPTLSKASAVSFGTTATADVQLARLNRLPTGGFAAEVRLHNEIIELHLPFLAARYQVLSVTAALAVGHALNISATKSAPALHAVTPRNGQGKMLRGIKDSRILDDSAAATPESMRMALETVRALPGRRRIAIIGDIDQLGAYTERFHREIGQLAAHVAPMVIIIGQSMRIAAKEAVKMGVDVHQFATATDAGKWLVDFVVADDSIVVSGGAHMHLSEVVERLHEA